VLGHTTSWAEKLKAEVMRTQTQKTDSTPRRFGRLMEPAGRAFCFLLPRGVHQKNFEKFAPGFFEEKTRGELPRPNQPKKIERTHTRPIKL
jgi:hypothetical protein